MLKSYKYIVFKSHRWQSLIPYFRIHQKIWFNTKTSFKCSHGFIDRLTRTFRFSLLKNFLKKNQLNHPSNNFGRYLKFFFRRIFWEKKLEWRFIWLPTIVVLEIAIVILYKDATKNKHYFMSTNFWYLFSLVAL